MWIMVMFDLPVMTKKQRKAANKYRRFLQGNGFSMLQFSVYMRWCISPKSTEAVINNVSAHVPAEGLVRIIRLTDEQWSRTQAFFGKKEVDPGGKPTQLVLFSQTPDPKTPGNPAVLGP
jgi:CRISPR-associated protein Cas2